MYLGIDLGTSGLKALLIDDHQRVVGSQTAPLSVQRPHPGWSEQDPASWCVALDAAMSMLAQENPNAMAAVRAIGLSGHMHGATLLDKDGLVLHPCMLWNDTRADVEARAMDMDPAFRAITGNIVFPGFTAPKLAWVLKNEPELGARIQKILLPKDYLRFYLSGSAVSEMSDASGTAWLDVANRCWSADLLTKSGLNISQMPELVEGSGVSATLKAKLATKWGMPPGVIIAGGAGDNAAAACGLGVVVEGQAFISLGTSGVLFTANDAFRPNPAEAVHAFCHALPNSWHQMGVILSATDALNWYAALVGKSAQELTQALGETISTAGEVVFLPYLSGERTPHNDAKIRGAFLNLDHGSDQKALTHAVLEGVGFALKDSLSALQGTGTKIDHLLATGGGAGSKYWLKLLSTILNLPISIPKHSDLGAALGAARLAMIADGHSGADVLQPAEIHQTFEPDAGLSAGYEAAYLRYRSAYPALKLLS